MEKNVKTLVVGQKVVVIGQYSGIVRRGGYTVKAVSPSGRKVTINHPDFATGQEVFFWNPTRNNYFNDYSGYLAAE